MKILAPAIFLTAGLAIPAQAAECRQGNAIYGDRDAAFELAFSPVGSDVAAISHQFHVKVLDTSLILDGHVLGSDPLNRPTATVLNHCPDGDVTGADLAACTVWEGSIYGHTDGVINLLPPEDAPAAAEILLAGFGDGLRNSSAWGPNKATVAPWDIFTLKGCKP
jgi:hypothetical protein